MEILDPVVQALMEAPPYDEGRWGIFVQDVNSGEVLAQREPATPFILGSTTKIFSVTAALEQLGPNRRFETHVVRTGELRSGVLAGDLILVASGDLTLGGRTRSDGSVDVPDFDHTDANALPGMATLTNEDPLAGLRELARRVRAAGIETVDGHVLVDDRLWDTFELDDVPISPIVVNDNLLDFSITPGSSQGAPTTFEFRPTPLDFAVVNEVVTGPQGGIDSIQLKTERIPSELRLQGTVPMGRSEPIVYTYQLQPALAARLFFLQALREVGVQIPQAVAGTLPSRDVVANATRVATFVSPSFSEQTRLINKVSHNLGANMLPMLLAVNAGIERPTLQQGMTLIRDFVAGAGIDRAEFTLHDGQGLPENRASPRAQVQFLRWLAGRPYFEVFRQSTPILGVDGSLKDVLPPGDPARGHVRAKTGTLATSDGGRLLLQTKALAGYIDARGGRFLAFGVYLNDLPIQGLQDVFDANATLGKIASALQQRL